MKRKPSDLCERLALRRMPCLADIYTLSGLLLACKVCERVIGQMRISRDWQPVPGTPYFCSQSIAADQTHAIMTAIKGRQNLCQPDCGHTMEEHRAFDAAMLHAEQGGDNDNPYEGFTALWEAYESGYSVGALNRDAERRAAA